MPYKPDRYPAPDPRPGDALADLRRLLRLQIGGMRVAPREKA